MSVFLLESFYYIRHARCKVALVVSDSLQPYGLPGSSVHGICQARVLEWGAIAFSLGGHQSISISSCRPIIDICGNQFTVPMEVLTHSYSLLRPSWFHPVWNHLHLSSVHTPEQWSSGLVVCPGGVVHHREDKVDPDYSGRRSGGPKYQHIQCRLGWSCALGLVDS